MKVIKEVQKSIYEALTDVANGIQSSIEGVFYLAPDNTKTPYVTINNIKTDNISDFTNEVHRIHLDINVFDLASSNDNILTIMEEVKNIILSIDNLEATNYEFIEAMQQEAFIKSIDEGKIWNGLVRFEFYVKSK